MYRTRLAQVLIVQGRDDDALAELEQARGLSEGTPTWRAARARLLARRGLGEQAVALARDAVGSMVGSDDLTVRAEMLTDLAEVLYAAGDSAGATEALAEARELHEEKGNVLPAQRCRYLAAIAVPRGSGPQRSDEVVLERRRETSTHALTRHRASGSTARCSGRSRARRTGRRRARPASRARRPVSATSS